MSVSRHFYRTKKGKHMDRGKELYVLQNTWKLLIQNEDITETPFQRTSN